jgi:hypothetical protein
MPCSMIQSVCYWYEITAVSTAVISLFDLDETQEAYLYEFARELSSDLPGTNRQFFNVLIA